MNELRRNNNTMRILFIGPLPEPLTGHSLACQILFNELAKNNEVILLNLSRHSRNNLKRILDILKIIAEIRKNIYTCDIIYFTISESYWGNLKDLLIYLACFRRLSSMIIHLHGGAGMRNIMLGKNFLFRRLNLFFIRRISAVVILGKKLVDIFDILPREKIYIIPNCTEDCMFSNVYNITQKFNNLTPLRFLFLSNFLPGKGFIELVDAFCLLDYNTKSSIEIDFAGSFRSEVERQNFLSIIKQFPQLHYHGPVRQNYKIQLFHNAHIFCLPTYYPYEGQPISILEAYASGCVVVTTDHSGITDIFSDGVNGYMVDKKSSQSLKFIMEKIINNQQNISIMALNNFNSAQLYYKTEQYNSKLIQLINSIYVRHNRDFQR